jgi:hypothetical protein
MTRTTNARLAGYTFLFYIAVGIISMILFNQATRGAEGTAATLASIARHAPLVRLTAVLNLFTFFAAIVLAVTLYALTRDQDRDLALLALCCRAGEGVINAVATVRTLGLLSVATASAASADPDAAAIALGDQLLKMGGQYYLVSATCFAVGSTIYSYLFLRARSIPVALAGLGVFASILVVICLPLQLAGVVLPSWLALAMWLPMLAFEVTLALWLIIKGVAAPVRAPSS